MNSIEWPEPIVRVQYLSDSGIHAIPARYVRLNDEGADYKSEEKDATIVNIPVVDLLGSSMTGEVAKACKEWGFFQVTNHGVQHELMDRTRELWREFFHLPIEVKQKYANNPITYEGYGSRLGIEKDAVLDWSDYYFLNYLPPSVRNLQVWPSHPSYNREVTEEYLKELVKLGGKIMQKLSSELGLDENTFMRAFGGEAADEMAACIRINLYPKCPQPELTLGLAPHSDPGGITILLPDPNVSGLQVRKQGKWVTVKPLPHAFIVNIGDQMQVASNGVYKSVEHRVIVNSKKERVSLAFFHNPKSDVAVQPVKELVTPENPALYQPMTYSDYRLYIRTKGTQGKRQVESLALDRSSLSSTSH